MHWASNLVGTKMWKHWIKKSTKKLLFIPPKYSKKTTKFKYVADMVYNVTQTCSAYAYLVL